MARLGRIWRSVTGIAAIGALASGANAQANRPIERKLLVASFENIQVIGDIAVVVTTGKSPSGLASGDKRVLQSLKLERIGTTLRVRLQDVINNDRGVPITAPLRLQLSTQQVRDITLSGNGSVSVSEVKQQDLVRMLIAGNGSIRIGRLVADQYSGQIDGNGTIELGGGSVRDGRVVIDGAGSFLGEKAQMRQLRLQHDGNAISTATVAEATDIFNIGSGTITVGGKGTCFIKQAGAASINCAKIETEGAKK